jgi:trans-aconitate methyltransferase
VDLKEEHILGDEVKTHWYYRAKQAALLRTVSDIGAVDVLDVGAGSGYFSRALLDRTTMTGAVCVDPGYPADSQESVAGKPLAFRRNIDSSQAGLVLMMDVIEHVPDDVALISEYVAKVPPGTHFVVTVPAFMWLWSGHDVFLEHYRRYTLKQLETALTAAGLTVEHGHYFYGAVLPLVAAVRMAKKLTQGNTPPGSDMQRHGALANTILFGASRAEAMVMRANRLGGTTVMARAVKH